MKKILSLIAAVAALVGCQKHYELNSDFEMPTSLESPASVTLDVTSTQTVVLSWTGGKASDGGLILYEVLFDKDGGDFSTPVEVLPSDQGAKPQLTLSHAQLNAIARKAGIAPSSTGKVIWTVRGFKGGINKTISEKKAISITRGAGIDNMPEHLFIAGSAAKEEGQEFRVAEEGLYVIVSRLGAGKLRFTSENDGGGVFYATPEGQLVEGDGDYDIAEAPSTGLAIITVDFNTLSLKIDTVEAQLHAFWNINGITFMDLDYKGKGVFEGMGEVILNEESWGIEERYAFKTEVNGSVHRWGSSYENAAVKLPDGTEEFWYVYDQGEETSQWDFLWKMDHAMDQQNVKIVVNTNKDNKFTHSVESAGDIKYEQPKVTPAELYITGTAAEVDLQPFRKDGDKFIAYAKLKAGIFSVTDENATQYFFEADNSIWIGGKKSISVEASEEVTRITVDFKAKNVSFETIGTSVRMIWGCNYETVIDLAYSGEGKWAGEGKVVFVDPSRPETNPPGWLSWTEERYYFIVTIDGVEKCWGRLDGEDGDNRPDGEVSPTFYDLGEFEWSQWDHLWKMGSIYDNAMASATINTNDNGHIRHSFLKQSEDPFPPSVAPSELKLYGSASEAEGQAFRKIEDGVFVIFAKLKDGKLCFKGDGKNYFLGSESLMQGDGDYDVTASSGEASRIEVSFKTNTVTTKEVTKIDIVWGCNEQSPFALSYAGEGVWSGTGTIDFIDPGDPQFGLATWLTWQEERYRFLVYYDGEESASKCFGIWNDDGNYKEYRPGTPEWEAATDGRYYECTEYDRGGQWDHLWKMATEMDDSNVEIKVFTNKDGVLIHSVTKK